MGFIDFKLIGKKSLTIDTFELIFSSENILNIKPGQFITFFLTKTKFARAYSILDAQKNNIYFIIKRLENGRGGSKEICDIEEGTILKGIGPTGHFLVSEEKNNKLFIGTGTGLVPLYFQIKSLLENNYKNQIKLILGNRTLKDLYYIDILENIAKKYKNFTFEIYLSRDEFYNKGYVGSYLTKENISNFSEFYICGNPNMIDEVILILDENNIDKNKIHYEKF